MLRFTVILFLLAVQGLFAETKVLFFSGSTRAGSYNKKLLAEAEGIAKSLGAQTEVFDVKQQEIPFYDGDLEATSGMPEHAKALRSKMIGAQVIVIASPEYNSSFSAVLKNALDWASRGEAGGSSREAYKGKTFVLLSASPGGGGGKRGLVQLKTVIEAVGGTVFAEQFTLANAQGAFDEKGSLKNPEQKCELRTLLQEALCPSSQ